MCWPLRMVVTFAHTLLGWWWYALTTTPNGFFSSGFWQRNNMPLESHDYANLAGTRGPGIDVLGGDSISVRDKLGKQLISLRSSHLPSWCPVTAHLFDDWRYISASATSSVCDESNEKKKKKSRHGHRNTILYTAASIRSATGCSS